MRQVIVDTAFLIVCVSEIYIAALEGLSENKARHTIDTLIRVIRRGVYYKIWRPRCIRTRAVFKQEGITWCRSSDWRRVDVSTNTYARQTDKSKNTETIRPDDHSIRPHKINIDEINQVTFKTNNYVKYGFW
jgi:hypothetical protein